VNPERNGQEEIEEQFERHGFLLDCRTVAEYERSSKATINEGTYFTYRDRSTGEWRLGYYDRLTERFPAVNEDGDTVVTHFRCGER